MNLKKYYKIDAALNHYRGVVLAHRRITAMFAGGKLDIRIEKMRETPQPLRFEVDTGAAELKPLAKAFIDQAWSAVVMARAGLRELGVEPPADISEIQRGFF